jgi:hypothetical protein
LPIFAIKGKHSRAGTWVNRTRPYSCNYIKCVKALSAESKGNVIKNCAGANTPAQMNMEVCLFKPQRSTKTQIENQFLLVQLRVMSC